MDPSSSGRVLFDLRIDEFEDSPGVRVTNEKRNYFLFDAERAITADRAAWPRPWWAEWSAAFPESGEFETGMAEDPTIVLPFGGRSNEGHLTPIALEFLEWNPETSGLESGQIRINDLASLGFTFIGHDIVGRWLLSGICNCGRSAEEKARLQSRLRNPSSRYSLIESRTTALEAVALINADVPEHAPFTVVGVYVWSRDPNWMVSNENLVLP